MIARSQLVLRALAFLGPVVALLATAPAGQAPPWWLVLVVLALAAATAVSPDSAIGAGAGLTVLGWWALSLGDGLPGEAVVAGLALGVGHVAALLASYGPRSMPVDRATLLLWTRRGALVLLTVPGAWLVSRAVGDEPADPGLWVLALAVACVAVVGATVAIAPEEET